VTKKSFTANTNCCPCSEVLLVWLCTRVSVNESKQRGLNRPRHCDFVVFLVRFNEVVVIGYAKGRGTGPVYYVHNDLYNTSYWAKN
jgi:hypothetical protein